MLGSDPISVEVLALIPARAGSKSIPDKNIAPLWGAPLMAHSISHALEAKHISRVIVSTDSDDYAALARSFGAEVPFLRPAEFADDHATDVVVFEHALSWLDEHEGFRPDLIVHLRPTCPVRDVRDIDTMIETMASSPELSSLRSVSPARETPYKMWTLSDGRLTPLLRLEGVDEPYNQPRQILPPVYVQNAAIDVTRWATVMELGSMTGEVIGGYEISGFVDIDTRDQLAELDQAWPDAARTTEPKTYCVDIDGVIAHLEPDNDYARSSPRHDVIARVNALYHAGHRVVLFTARGSATGIDWQAVTEQQMSAWGVKYHELRFGKPAADYYIDDRNYSLNRLLLEEP